MSSKPQPVRGTQDLFSKEVALHRIIEDIAFKKAIDFGYEEIRTPIFETSSVFHRSLGETSDAVAKETYTFLDRGGEELTLRPEGTAGIARAFISNGMMQNLPLKFFYSGPMFRYERPQKGRFRQFHQIGVECLGLESPTSDIECIQLGIEFIKALSIGDLIQVEINSLGDTESRSNHRTALVSYLQNFKSQLSPDSQVRLEKNPLRILDSKDENDRKILKEAPQLQNYLNDSSKAFFEKVIEGLASLGHKVTINSNLVRGLDYYTHTVFEITTTHLGAQSAVLAGGRYNGLVETLGGPPTVGVGWAAGVERLALLGADRIPVSKKQKVCIVNEVENEWKLSLKIASDLRDKNFCVEIIEGTNLGKMLKKANKLGANWAIIIGSDEISKNEASIKNFSTGNQIRSPFAEIQKHLI